MRIAWDGRGIAGARTGIGWYSCHLLRGFASLDADLSADLWINRRIADDFGPRIRHRLIRYPDAARLRWLWEEGLLPVALSLTKPDVWFSPLSLIPRGYKGACAATVHDVAFLFHPEILPPQYLQYWTRRITHACQRADRIIAVSESTKQDLLKRIAIPESRIVVIHEAAAPFYNEAPSGEEVDAVNMSLNPPDEFFLFVGTLEPRKNLSLLLDVYDLWRKEGKHMPPLLVGGAPGWLQEKLKARFAVHGDNVRSLGYLTPQTLRVLYRRARLVLVPSLYEGFGLQAAEAMACGGAVIAADVSSLPEVVGDGGILLPIGSAEIWKDRIEEIHDDDAFLAGLREKALRRSLAFSWGEAAQKTFEVFRGIVG